MGALSETYVNPSIAADSGTGTIGDPYGDLQYALNTMTRDGTNGDRVNVKSGTDEVLTGLLDLATYGTPSGSAPLVLQGYTSAAGDGGIGSISGNGTHTSFNTAKIAITIQDMKIYNTGAAAIATLGQFCIARNCEFSGTSGNGLVMASECEVDNCHLHDIGGDGINIDGGAVTNCYFKDGTNKFTRCINFTTANEAATAFGNIISLDSTGDGIRVVGRTATAEEIIMVAHNTLFTSGTGGTAVEVTNDLGAGITPGGVWNNLAEGWDTFIDYSGATTRSWTFIGGNAGYDNTTDYSLGDIQASTTDDNESLGASPIAKSGADTWANRATYFKPVDTGNVYSPLGGNFAAKGAIQDGVDESAAAMPMQGLHPIEAGLP